MTDLNEYRRALVNLADALTTYQGEREQIESELDDLRDRLMSGSSDLYDAYEAATSANPIEALGGDPGTAPGLPDYDELTSEIPSEDEIGAGFDCHISIDTDEVFSEVSDWIDLNGGEALALRAAGALDVALESSDNVTPGFMPSGVDGEWMVVIRSADALALVETVQSAHRNLVAERKETTQRLADQAAALRMLRADLHAASLALASARDQVVATDNAAADRAAADRAPEPGPTVMHSFDMD